MAIAKYIQGILQRGQHHFTTEEAVKELGGDRNSVTRALNRLKAKGELATPQRGFYVVVLPEYRSLGCLPAEQFVPQLMVAGGEPYYIALLSAAQLHGAAHQRPQRFQVMVKKPRASIQCGTICVDFYVRRDLERVSTVTRNTPRGHMRVSSPEATALELVGYAKHSGELNNVATILAELAESIESERLVEEAARAPLAWSQRLGFLLELRGAAGPREQVAALCSRTRATSRAPRRLITQDGRRAIEAVAGSYQYRRGAGLMIPRDFVTEWRNEVPWPSDEQVEQDLVISRAVIEIFKVDGLASRLAWRGGTALHKLYLQPPTRYSEDIDLVQVGAEPIGHTLDILRGVLDPWLGEPRRVFKEGRVNMVYRFDSEGLPSVRLRLKIEINTREHFTVFGHTTVPFLVASKWFMGQADVTTFTLEELLGTNPSQLTCVCGGFYLLDVSPAERSCSLGG